MFIENSDKGVDLDQYLNICEAMGVEPNPADMPPDFSDFQEEVQLAYSIFALLPARIAEFSGTYLGKDFGNLSFFFDMYDIDQSWRMFYFKIILTIDRITSRVQYEKSKEKVAKSPKGKK